MNSGARCLRKVGLFVHGVLLVLWVLRAVLRRAVCQGTGRAEQALGRLPGSAALGTQVNAYLCSLSWHNCALLQGRPVAGGISSTAAVLARC